MSRPWVAVLVLLCVSLALRGGRWFWLWIGGTDAAFIDDTAFRRVSTLSDTLGFLGMTWAIVKQLRKQVSPRPEAPTEIRALFNDTEVLAARKVWRLSPTREVAPLNIEEVKVALSATLSNRIPTTLLEVRPPPLGGRRRIANVSEALRTSKKDLTPYAITGPPGSGKTFEMLKLYADYRNAFRHQDRDWLPLLVFVNELPPKVFEDPTTSHSLRDFVVAYLRHTRYPSAVCDHFANRASEYRCVVLIDGLDELPDKGSYEDAFRCIKEYFVPEAKRRGWRLILTARTEDYDPRAGMIELELEPLSPRQMEKLYAKHSGKSQSSMARTRHRAWTRLSLAHIPWFQPYISNPYFLALMLEAIEDGIPAGRPYPVSLRDLFARALRRELLKRGGAASIGEGRAEEMCLAVIAFTLLNRTVDKQPVQVDLGDSEDLMIVAQLARSVSTDTEPFCSLWQFSAASGSAADIPLDRLFRLLGPGLCAEIREKRRALEEDPGAGSADPLTRGLLSKLGATGLRADSREAVAMVLAGYLIRRLAQRAVDAGLLRADANLVATSFRHRRLMEYLAALYLMARPAALAARAHNLWYKQTLLILAAIADEPRWLIEAAATGGPDDFVLAGELVASVHPDVVSADPNLVGLVVGPLAAVVSGPIDPPRQLQALACLRSLVVAGRWTPERLFVTHVCKLLPEVVMYDGCLAFLSALPVEKGPTLLGLARALWGARRNTISLPLPRL
jgi:hypothetical protein